MTPQPPDHQSGSSGRASVNPAPALPPASGPPQTDPAYQPPIAAGYVTQPYMTSSGGPAPAVLTLQQTSWQGPYPSPEAIERFEAVMPGSWHRILEMAERSQAAQIESERRGQEFLQRDTRRAHYLGAVISVSALLGAVVCAYFQSPVIGAALVSLPVMSVVQTLFRRAQPAEKTVTRASENSG